MKGRKPTLKIVEGNSAPDMTPAPPDWLPPYAQQEWRRVAPDLFERGLIKETDMAALEAYCAAIAGVRETAEILAKEPRVFSSPAGPKPHPANRMQIQYLESARRYAAELGLTPVARHRSSQGATTPDDDDAADLRL